MVAVAADRPVVDNTLLQTPAPRPKWDLEKGQPDPTRAARRDETGPFDGDSDFRNAADATLVEMQLRCGSNSLCRSRRRGRCAAWRACCCFHEPLIFPPPDIHRLPITSHLSPISLTASSVAIEANRAAPRGAGHFYTQYLPNHACVNEQHHQHGDQNPREDAVLIRPNH